MSNIQGLQRKYGFKTAKALGQNFLNDDNAIEEIARASGAGPEDLVVEIGPGLGVLTTELADRAGKLVAVELDERLIPILHDVLCGYRNVDIINEDILKVDWDKILGENGILPDGSPYKDLYIVGNLPYYITTPILLGLLEKRVPAKAITAMVQREVADRIVAKPGGKDYGVLSISLQYYCSCKKVLDVPAESFIPAPKVDSAVVVLELKKERPLSGKDEENFFALVKKAFSQRRKTLLNSLDGFKGKGKQEIEKILIANDIEPKRRPETLSVEEYIKLSKEIKNA